VTKNDVVRLADGSRDTLSVEFAAGLVYFNNEPSGAEVILDDVTFDIEKN
jgi:hypothetical protein